MSLDRYRPDFVWSDEAVQRLAVLYTAGDSYSQCAAKLKAEFGGDPSRSSIGGKIMRAGLRLKPDAVAAPRSTKGALGRPRKSPKPKLRVVPSFEPEIIDLPPDRSDFACSILELTENTCRWPLADPSYDTTYCGSERQLGAYCARHARLAYRPAWRRG